MPPCASLQRLGQNNGPLDTNQGAIRADLMEATGLAMSDGVAPGLATRRMRALHRRPVMYFAGLDAHLKFVSVAVLDRMGKVALETTVFHAAGDRTFGPFGRNVLSRL